MRNMIKNEDEDEDEDYIAQIKHSCKHHHLDDVGRPGRLSRQERKYRRGPFHIGKGKTLRSHRKGK